LEEDVNTNETAESIAEPDAISLSCAINEPCRRSLLREPTGNPCIPENWSGIPLRYSLHASKRIRKRKLPFVECLPTDARLADVDYDTDGGEAFVFKVIVYEVAFFLVVGADGYVITAYRNGREHAERRERRKAIRRQLLSRGCEIARS